MPPQLTSLINAISGGVVSYLTAFAAIGALTMAVIQTVKELTPVRAWFHRRELERWLIKGVGSRMPHDDAARRRRSDRRGFGDAGDLDRLALSSPFGQGGRVPDESGVDLCRRQLIALSTAGDAAALYALDIEKLAGQLNAAAGIVVDFPSRYPELLQCLARHAESSDIQHLVHTDPHDEPEARSDRARKQAWDRHLERKVRVTHQIQRNIDGFQISVHYRWSWILQLCSFVLSFAIAAVAMMRNTPDGGLDRAALFNSLPLALIAGFLAPIARDLVAIIRRK